MDETVPVEDEERSLNLRKNYMHLLDGMKDKEKAKDPQYIASNDREADDLFQQVQRPREAVYDSTLLALKVQHLHQQTQAIQTGVKAFDGEQFANMLLENAQGTLDNSSQSIFSILGSRAQSVFSTPPPSFTPLYVCFDENIVPQQRKERQVREKDKVGELKKPTLVDSSASADKEASEIAQRILNILHCVYMDKGSKPICYFSFVVNPESFSETVENMFYVAVLAREGTVKMFSDNDELPVIEPVPLDEAEKLKRDGTYSQSIISINKTDFQNIVKNFKITKAMITHKNRNK